MDPLIVILALGGIIVIHEMGHLMTGILLRIPIERFSIGFGPKLIGRRYKGIDYRISLIPFGGYVLPKMKDLEEFRAISPRKRALFSLGGPAANMVLAFILLSVMNIWQGGFSIANITLVPFLQLVIGTISMVGAIISLLFHPTRASGVVGLVSQGGSFIDGSFLRTLVLAISLNLNLAIFNLLPIPVLDGGKVLMALLEKIDRRLVKFQVPATIASLILVGALMLLATINDIISMISTANIQ